MVKGIYKITNNRTGEVYIGQSKDIESRKNTHFKELSQREHHNNGMQNDYSSGDTFSFEILEEIPNATKADLYNKESQYIKKFNSFHEGYNQTPGGSMDQFKGKYKYGGGRLPVDKYHKITTDYSLLEIDENEPNLRNTKILITISEIITLICFIAYITKFSIFGALTGDLGLVFTIIFVLITIMLRRSLSSKSNKLDAINIKKILNENSFNIENKIIETLLSLNRNQKQIFCDVYNIPNNDETILKFIDKHWYSNLKSDYLIGNWRRYETEDLNTVLYHIRRNRPDIYYPLLSETIPKSIANKILIRDDYTCQKCGRNLLEFETEEELTKYKPHYSIRTNFIHLIKSLEVGGTITEDNLITACYKSCNAYHVPSKELTDIYENTSPPNSNQKLSRIERNGLSFKFPDNYLVAKIPNNCPECAVALTKEDEKCDILVEIAKDKIYYNQDFDGKYMNYVKNLDGFIDIKKIDIDRINKERKKIKVDHDKSCFITTSNVERQSNKKGIVKSIIYFDFDQNGKTIRITLNSLLDDKYNCMNDLYVIANSLKFKL